VVAVGAADPPVVAGVAAASVAVALEDSEAEVREEVAQVAAGDIGPRRAMVEAKVADFVSRLQRAAGANLRAVVLYGSAVSGEFDAEFSDINVLCILGDTSLAALAVLAPTVRWWKRRARALPLFLTNDELVTSADVFAIELLDLKSNYRLLYGSDDLIARLAIPMHLHRAQLEYEMREKLILLRQQLMLAVGNRKHTWELLLRSLSAYLTFFRHVLIARGEQAPISRREIIHAVGAALGLELSAFQVVVDVRDGKKDLRDIDAYGLATEYLTTVEQVTREVDVMLDTSSQS
jgi:predicted nucleotidyltransferase